MGPKCVGVFGIKILPPAFSTLSITVCMSGLALIYTKEPFVDGSFSFDFDKTPVTLPEVA